MIAIASARSDFMNLSRAGVAKKRSRTSTTVPQPSAAGRTAPVRPPSTVTAAASDPAARLVSVSRATAPRLASASPRNPKERMSRRSVPSVLEVAWRASARGRSAAVMPQPSSVTRISALPPSAYSTAIRRAPASSAFSTSSLTAEAGRSTTSPAAIRSMARGSSWRITGRVTCGAGLIWGGCSVMPPCLAWADLRGKPEGAFPRNPRQDPQFVEATPSGWPTTTKCSASGRRMRLATRATSSRVTASIFALRVVA